MCLQEQAGPGGSFKTEDQLRDAIEAFLQKHRMGSRMQTTDSGYGIVPECLSNHECDEIVGILSPDRVCRGRAGARHLMNNSAVSALANDNRLPKEWLIPWHQDTALPLVKRFDLPGWGPRSENAGTTYAHAHGSALSRVIALRVHLDDSIADNGPLRVVPGSHVAGVLSDQAAMEFVSTNARSVKSRRVLHIEYADSLEFADGVSLAVV